MGGIRLLSQEEFTAHGREFLGDFREAGQEVYENHWLGNGSPQHGAGKIFLLGDQAGAARLGIWKPHSGDPSFFLYARSASAGPEAVQGFLGAAKSFARVNGMAEIFGPLPFSTWHPYRFIRQMGQAPFFPGEQKMPAEWHADFVAAGFEDIAEYQSTMVEDLGRSIEVGLAMGVDKGLSGMDIRVFGSNDLPKLMPELYRASCEIFQDNFAYAPIAYADFLRLSSGGKSMPSVLILASVAGQTAGFAFSYGIGAYDSGNGAAPTAVLKTLGVMPEFRSRGLGYAVSYLTHKHWLENGHSRIIHAYMKTDNRSRSMSAHFGESLRTYALMRGKT